MTEQLLLEVQNKDFETILKILPDGTCICQDTDFKAKIPIDIEAVAKLMERYKSDKYTHILIRETSLVFGDR